MLLHERLYTAEEFWDFCQQPENAEKHFELIEGILYEMSPGNLLHGDIIGYLHTYMGIHIFENQLGRITGAETGFRLSAKLVLAPDIAFISQARMPKPVPEKFALFAPDLAVEVVSPGNNEAEINHKVQLYLQYGTRLVWIIYPMQKMVHVYRAGAIENQAIVTYLDKDATLNGEDVLPAFTMPLQRLFAE